MSCREQLKLGEGCPVETCHKEREHRGPHVIRYTIQDIKIEIRWEKVG